MISEKYSTDKTYYLMPGTVISKTDGDQHKIGASQLARLYGVPLSAPNVHVLREEEQSYARTISPDQDVFLYPDSGGEYELPE